MSEPLDKVCPHCSVLEHTSGDFCPHCGTPYAHALAETSPKKPSGFSRLIHQPKVWEVTVVVVGLFVLLAGGATATALKIDHDNKLEAKREEAAARKRIHGVAVAKFKRCESQLQPLIDELSELSSRINVGMNNADYTSKLGDVQIAYDQLDIAEQDADCTHSVGVPAEETLNHFIKAANAWDECIEDIDCEDAEPTLQKHWTRASISLEEAESGLSDMQPGPLSTP